MFENMFVQLPLLQPTHRRCVLNGTVLKCMNVSGNCILLEFKKIYISKGRSLSYFPKLAEHQELVEGLQITFGL